MHQDGLCNDTCSLRYGIAAVVCPLTALTVSLQSFPKASSNNQTDAAKDRPPPWYTPFSTDVFFFILLSFCWFLLISSLSLFSFYLFIHLFFPRCVLHGWSTKLAVLTVAAVQFKTTHKYTNAPTLDTYSMLLPETTCNRAKLKLTSEDSGVIHYST